MQIERLAVALRPRSAWEAIDLGLRMARVWWRPLCAAWWATTLPVALLLAALFPGHPWLCLVALWWLKPVFERGLLFVLSRGVFGDLPDWRVTLRALPGQLRRGAFWALTLGRVTRARSFTLAVEQLEGLRGSARTKRKAVLRRDVLGVAWAFQSTCAFLELSVVLSLYGLALLLVPTLELRAIWDGLGNDWVTGYDWLHYALTVISFAAVAPFYVAGGFALYLNRRMQLEGWDIELTFRKLAARVEQDAAGRGEARSSGGGDSARRAAALLLALGIAAAAALAPLPAQADEPLAASEARRVIDDLLAAESNAQWMLRRGDRGSAMRLPGVGEWMAQGLRVLAIAAAVAGLLYFLSKLEWSRLESRVREDEDEIPESVAGLDIRPESLPDDVVAAAIARWREGAVREAMSLLYRGALLHLVRDHGLRVPESATEGECLRALSPADPGASPLRDDFAALTESWQRVAYAHETPIEESFRDLCRRWQRHLRRRPQAGGARP